ncbi:hypothetical protein [Variovorax sp. dw_954]|uniref:hypothetical protein n=1 Tax=Variovorax sp. dw_954 TaxID=2720078 RepID=UPI001BD661C8|nr:hypothetical protein [Variovorax sp. dw_954]
MTKFTREEFEDSYRRWRCVAAQHSQMLLDAMAGKPVSIDRMHQVIAEMERLQDDWCAKSWGHIRWEEE